MTTYAGEVVEKREHFCIAGGNASWYNHFVQTEIWDVTGFNIQTRACHKSFEPVSNQARHSTSADFFIENT